MSGMPEDIHEKAAYVVADVASPQMLLDGLGTKMVRVIAAALLAEREEAMRNAKANLRLAFRKALADLPEIAPAEVASVLSSVHMRDEIFNEGKRLQCVHGTDAVAPRVEQECGAGAWSFMRQGVLAAKQPDLLRTPSEQQAVRKAIREGKDG